MHFFAHLASNVVAPVRPKNNITSSLDHCIAAATVLNTLLQLISLLSMLSLRMIVDCRASKVNALEHLNVFFDLFCLFFAAVYVIQ